MAHQGLKSEVSETEVREISLGEIFSALLKWWWVVALCLVAVPLMAYYYTIATYVPVYTASMVINSKQTDFVGGEPILTNDLDVSEKLVNTYTEVLTSNRVMELVYRDLHLNMPVDVLRSYVTVKPVKDTEVLMVEVNYPDSVLSEQICNAIMKVAPEAIASTVEVGSINILDNAKVPESHMQKTIYRNVGAGGLLGLLLGLVLVFLLLYFDNTIKNDEDVKNKLGLTLLGSIPYQRIRSRKGRGAPLVDSAKAGFGFVEAYKSAGTNFRFAAAVKEAKTLLVSGALTGEGKSTVSVNLALTIAQTGKSVLLVDCDLRKSNIHKVLKFKASEHKGLASVLIGDAKVEECIVFLEGRGLHVLPNDFIVPNPSELLGSEKMGGLISTLEEQYDYIILDTPPSYLLTDAVALSVYADGVILVVKQGYTKTNIINDAKAGFATAGVPVLGCILNGIKYSSIGAFNHNRYNERYLGKYYKDYARVNKTVASNREIAAAGDND